MLRFLAAALALSPTFSASAQDGVPSTDDRDPILYVMEDSDSRVYLLGSIHLLDEAAYPLPADVVAAYNDADALAFEIDLSDVMAVQSAVMGRAQYADGRTLEEAMGEDHAKLDSVLAPFGVPAASFSAYEPWAVHLTLSGLAVQSLGYSPQNGVDLYFSNRAQADGKDRLSLETADSQIAIFDAMPEQEQVEMLVEMLDGWDEQGATFSQLVSAWETGDEAAMATLMHDLPDSIRPALLRDRNAAWVPQIEAMLAREAENVLVVVGAGHLAGEDSMISMLRERGHTLTRL